MESIPKIKELELKNSPQNNNSLFGSIFTGDEGFIERWIDPIQYTLIAFIVVFIALFIATFISKNEKFNIFRIYFGIAIIILVFIYTIPWIFN